MTAHARETTVDDRLRARRIVVRASEATKVDKVKLWLHDDDQGSWERLAADYLADTEVKAAELHLTPEQVDTEIAERLAQLARLATRDDLAKRQAARAARQRPRARP